MNSCLLQTKSLSVNEVYVSCNSLAVKVLLAADVVAMPSKFTNEKWKTAQRADEAITQVISYLQKKPDTKVDRKSLSVEACGMLRQKDKLVLKSDLLYRQLASQLQDQPTYQFVLPKKYRQQALTACHDDVGLFSIERTSCLIKDQFY